MISKEAREVLATKEAQEILENLDDLAIPGPLEPEREKWIQEFKEEIDDVYAHLQQLEESKVKKKYSQWEARLSSKVDALRNLLEELDDIDKEEDRLATTTSEVS